MNTLIASACIGLLALTLASEVCAENPWDMKDLRRPPKHTELSREGNLVSMYYEGEPYKGKPTKVFAYCAYPKEMKGRMPAVVLVHGGAGKAYPEWAQMWADRGYVALAMDHFGQGPDVKPQPDGGPALDGATVFGEGQIKDSWPYHAVADVVLGISLLSSMPEVDPKRIGITGISWGGYLTCIVAGLDDRLRAAVPVYGCGYLHEGSAWLDSFEQMTPGWRKEWVERFEPSSYLAKAKMPMLFVNGTNDFAFWLDSYRKSYRIVRSRTVCIKPNMPHSQGDGASPQEIGVFMDQHLKGGKPLLKVSKVKLSGGEIEVSCSSAVPVREVVLLYTTDSGNWRDRKWQSAPAVIEGPKARATLPKTRPIAWFLNLTDERGCIVSTEHEVIE